LHAMQMRRRAWLTAWAIGIGLAAPPAEAAAPAEEPTPLAGIPNSPVHAIAVDGTTAYVGGEFRHVSRYTGGFAALDPVSSQLAPGWPAVDGRVYALAPDGAGGWYLGGDFSAVGGVARRHLAHVRADRTVDPAWAPSTDRTVYSIAAFGTAVFAGGIFSTVNGGTTRTSLAAFDAATGAVTDFTGGLSDGAEVWTMAVQAGAVVAGDARLYVGGRFSLPQKNLVSYDLATGAPDPAFDPVVTGSSVRTLLIRDLNPHPIFTDITVYVGGDFSKIDGQPRENLAALKPDGTLLAWGPILPPGGFGGDFVYALAARASTVYVGGGFGLAAYHQTTGASTGWSARVDYQAQALTVVGSTVYVGGMFFRVDGDAWRTNLAAFDAATGEETSWDPEASEVPVSPPSPPTARPCSRPATSSPRAAPSAAMSPRWTCSPAASCRSIPT
jgi:hypothetical protein